MPRPKKGRPSIYVEGEMNTKLFVRCTKGMKADILRLARAQGLSISEWCRDHLDVCVDKEIADQGGKSCEQL